MTPIEARAVLREEFVRLLTENGPTTDRRRRDFNQALFFPEDDPQFPGRPVWDRIDLYMVLNAYDQAIKNLNKENR